jgi:serine/threonine protein kinase
MASKKPEKPPIYGDWELIHFVDRGNFGVAYKARNIKTNQLAAIKFLSPLNRNVDPDELAAEKKRFENEIKKLSSLNSKYISRLYDADLNSNPPWMAMQFFSGTRVLDEVNENGPIGEKEWFDLAKDILSALEYIHGQSPPIVHRDLNPKNVMLIYGGGRIIDFGISRIEGAAKSATHFYGYPGFTSPEHYLEKADAKNDIFVAATLLAYAGTGKIPWARDREGSYMESIASHQPVYVGLSPSQISFLDLMHEKNPHNRISASEALKIISNIDENVNFNKSEQVKKIKPLRKVEKPALDDKSESFLSRNKIPILLGIFTGGWGLIPYWLMKKNRSSNSINDKEIILIAASAIISFFSYGSLLFIPSFYASKKFKDRKLFWIGAGSSFLFLPAILSASAKDPNGELTTGAGFYLCGILVLVLMVHRRIFKLKTSGLPELENNKLKQKKKSVVDLAFNVDTKNEKVAEIEEVHYENVTTAVQSWSEVESIIFDYLASRKGKHFTIEVISNHQTGIYLQGYSEPGGYITVEAASNVSVNPHLSVEQRKGLIKIGWEPPSEGLPNFIKFLDLVESENIEISKLFVNSIKYGYGLEIGTFKIEV